MTSIDQRIDRFLKIISGMRFLDIDIKEITRLLGVNLATRGCILFKGGDILYQYKITPEQLKGEYPTFNYEMEIGKDKYIIYLVFNPAENINPSALDNLRSILKIIEQIFAISSVSRTRISEFQTINELNLNVITTLELNKVIWFVESAAQKLLETDRVYLYYLVEDRIVGKSKSFSIKILPPEIYLQISQSRRIMKLQKKDNKFLKSFFNNSPSGSALLVPFTIKNTGRGFFIMDNFDNVPNPTNVMMRLKFLGNQAAIALERIELFQALNKALQESKGLQDIAKLLLSPYELNYFFNEVLRRAQEMLGFRKIMCSVYDPSTDSFKRLYAVGISSKKFREAKRVHPPYQMIKSIMQERFRISNSYYVPSEEVNKEIRGYEVYKTPSTQKRIHNLWLPGDILITPIYSRNGEILGILSLAEPIDNRVPDRSKIRLLEAFGDFLGLAMENNQLFEKNVMISYTDELTGVYNYRFLREKLNELIQKRQKLIAIGMIDLDRFKEYNDRYGHLAGDNLLKIVSQLLKEVIDTGYVTRYGGDEFIIILPGAGVRALKSKIEKARMILQQRQGHGIKIDFSCGFASYPEDGTDFGTLIDSADKRLYMEKRKKYNETVS
jgi:diguanylate cyclase (GGDEF)-like protein